jgi:hemerythrin-like domain-containing protein
MLRDKNLVPLSRQHQHALALCVRIDRTLQAEEADCSPWQAEMWQLWQQEVAVHFAAEETILFPAAARFPELQELVSQLLDEHRTLRTAFERASRTELASQDLLAFGAQLSGHIRKEERHLFEALQKLLGPDEFNQLGDQLQSALAGAADACIIPTEATRLRPQRSK